MIFMEYCNVCEREVDEPKEHINSNEHKSNLEKLRKLFEGKIYDDNRIGITP